MKWWGRQAGRLVVPYVSDSDRPPRISDAAQPWMLPRREGREQLSSLKAVVFVNPFLGLVADHMSHAVGAGVGAEGQPKSTLCAAGIANRRECGQPPVEAAVVGSPTPAVDGVDRAACRCSRPSWSCWWLSPAMKPVISAPLQGGMERYGKGSMGSIKRTVTPCGGQTLGRARTEPGPNSHQTALAVGRANARISPSRGP